eukprot:5210346-Pyramimonas_sp.AAC.1
MSRRSLCRFRPDRLPSQISTWFLSELTSKRPPVHQAWVARPPANGSARCARSALPATCRSET